MRHICRCYTGYSDVVDSVISAGGRALLKPYSLARLEAVLTEQLYEHRPAAIAPQLAVKQQPANYRS